MWLNDSSVEVFIWDSECCVQWTWIITSCPHLSQQHINGDDNLNVSIGIYFIPCARMQRESSQPSPFPCEGSCLREITFWCHHFLLTYPHTSPVKKNSRWKSFTAQWMNLTFNISVPLQIKFYSTSPHLGTNVEAQPERAPLYHFPKLRFNYITLIKD